MSEDGHGHATILLFQAQGGDVSNNAGDRGVSDSRQLAGRPGCVATTPRIRTHANGHIYLSALPR